LQHRIHEVGDFKRWVATALGMKKRSVPPYNFGGTLSARGATCAMRTLVSAPSNRHGLSLCHKYNPKQLRWFMLVPATGQFGVPRSKACAQARRYLVLSHTAHFRNALKCVGASGRLPSGNLQIKAVDCRILLRFVVLYYALFSAFGAASPFLPAFLAGRGLGAEELGVVVRQPQCDWFAVPLPGVSPTVSSSFEQNLPSAPSWPQARRSSISQSMGFGR
jgi:hypothetical protein